MQCPKDRRGFRRNVSKIPLTWETPHNHDIWMLRPPAHLTVVGKTVKSSDLSLKMDFDKWDHRREWTSLLYCSSQPQLPSFIKFQGKAATAIFQGGSLQLQKSETICVCLCVCAHTGASCCWISPYRKQKRNDVAVGQKLSVPPGREKQREPEPELQGKWRRKPRTAAAKSWLWRLRGSEAPLSHVHHKSSLCGLGVNGARESFTFQWDHIQTPTNACFFFFSSRRSNFVSWQLISLHNRWPSELPRFWMQLKMIDRRGEFKTLQTFRSLIWVKDCKLPSQADRRTVPTRLFCIRHPALLPRGFHHSPRWLPGFLRQRLLWLLSCYLGDANVWDNKSCFCFGFLAACAGDCLVFRFVFCIVPPLPAAPLTPKSRI